MEPLVRRVLADIPCRLEMTRCYAVTLHVQSFKGTRPCDCLERIFAGRLLVVFVSLCLLLRVAIADSVWRSLALWRSLTLWRSLSPCGDRCPSGGIPPIGTAIGLVCDDVSVSTDSTPSSDAGRQTQRSRITSTNVSWRGSSCRRGASSGCSAPLEHTPAQRASRFTLCFSRASLV